MALRRTLRQTPEAARRDGVVALAAPRRFLRIVLTTSICMAFACLRRREAQCFDGRRRASKGVGRVFTCRLPPDPVEAVTYVCD
jgi:hypothetical protein